MTEIVDILKDQVEKLNLVIEGLQDKSKLSYPSEYDRGKSLLSEVETGIKKAKRRLSDRGYLSWLSSRL